MVSSTVRPASASAGEAVQRSVARRAAKEGATRPVTRTAASSAPTAWTQPDPLEWATPAQANMATTLPTTGAIHGHRMGPRRSRRPCRRCRRPGRETPQDSDTPATRATSPAREPASTVRGPKTARMTTTPQMPATTPAAAVTAGRLREGRLPGPLVTWPGRACRR